MGVRTGALPDALTALIGDRKKRRKDTPGTLAAHRETSASMIPETMRNNWLFSSAARLRRSGLCKEAIEEAVKIQNRRRCCPPLPDSEVQRLARSASNLEEPPEWLLSRLDFVNDPSLRPSDRFVLLAIADHADDEGLAWPGQDRLAELTGYSRPTVSAAVKRLEAHGRIETSRKVRMSNRYRLRSRSRSACDPPPTTPALSGRPE